MKIIIAFEKVMTTLMITLDNKSIKQRKWKCFETFELEVVMDFNWRSLNWAD